MAIEAKDIWQVLGFEGKIDLAAIEKPEDFKGIFEKEFTSKSNPDKDLVNKIVGSEYGKFRVALKRSMKEAGVEYDLTEEDSKAKDFTDLLKYSSEKITKALTAQIDELKTKSGQGNDEKIKEYEAELNKAKLRFSEEAELKSKVMKEYDEFKAKSAGEFKNYKKTIELSEIQKRALKFASSVKPLEQTGFLSYFNEKYDFDYNDEGHILPVDKKTGAFIPNPKVTGKYLTPEEVYEMEGVKANVWEKNPHQQSGQPGKFNQPAPVNGQEITKPAGAPVRQVNTAGRV